MSKLAMLLYQSVHGKGVHASRKLERWRAFRGIYTDFFQGRNHMVPSKCCLSQIEKACDFPGGRSIFEVITDQEPILHLKRINPIHGN